MLFGSWKKWNVWKSKSFLKDKGFIQKLDKNRFPQDWSSSIGPRSYSRLERPVRRTRDKTQFPPCILIGLQNLQCKCPKCQALIWVENDDSFIISQNYDIVQQPFDLAFFSVSAIRAALVNTSWIFIFSSAEHSITSRADTCVPTFLPSSKLKYFIEITSHV